MEPRKSFTGVHGGKVANLHGRGTKLEVWKLDLSEFDSVKAFAAKCERELERLDVFLSNAALLVHTWTQTKDGWETA